jgi:cytochrome c oxidase subunit IV
MNHVEPVEAEEAVKTRHYPTSRTYVLVFAALVVLTLVEVGVAYIEGGIKAPLLLGMSAIKALLVILFFMHLKYDSRWFAFIFFAPMALVIPLIWISLIR